MASKTVKDLLTAQWDSGNVTAPTFFDLNDATTPIRINLRTADYLVITLDRIQYDPIGTWIYGHERTQIAIEVYTKDSRQRLYNLARETRRVCNDRIHSVTGYQRIQYQSFNEMIDTPQDLWIGRISIELLNSATIRNTSD